MVTEFAMFPQLDPHIAWLFITLYRSVSIHHLVYLIIYCHLLSPRCVYTSFECQCVIVRICDLICQNML